MGLQHWGRRGRRSFRTDVDDHPRGVIPRNISGGIGITVNVVGIPDEVQIGVRRIVGAGDGTDFRPFERPQNDSVPVIPHGKGTENERSFSGKGGTVDIVSVCPRHENPKGISRWFQSVAKDDLHRVSFGVVAGNDPEP